MPPTFSRGLVAGDRHVIVGIDSCAQNITGGESAEYRHVFWCATPSHLQPVAVCGELRCSTGAA